MIGVVGVLFVAGIVLFNFVLMPVLVHNRAAVIVPDLRQISEAQASETLEKLALTLRVTHSENSAEVPEGYVISQSPRPNESIKEGRSVEVVLSLGAKTQRVPDLAGMSLRQVRGMLDRLQLRAGRVSRVPRRPARLHRSRTSRPGRSRGRGRTAARASRGNAGRPR